MSKEELKPCLCWAAVRWCGDGNDDPADNHECHQVRCDSCGAQFYVDNFEDENTESTEDLRTVTAKAWNTRAPQSEWVSVESYKDIPVGTWQVAMVDRGWRDASTCIAVVHDNVAFIGNAFAFDMPRVYAYCKCAEIPNPPKGA